MNQAKWLSGTDPVAMLAYCAGKFGRWTTPSFERLVNRYGPRKLGLYGVACCRQLWDRLDTPARELIESFEAYCDGLISTEEIFGRHTATRSVSLGVPWLIQATGKLYCIGEDTDMEYWEDLKRALKAVQRDSAQAMFKERIQQAHLLREVFGNPFRAREAAPGWRSHTAVALARRAYEERDWSMLPVLADALEEAGCQDVELLQHCRRGSDHYRGCWAVDRILNRTGNVDSGG
jgi:hypothetical protein